MKFLRNEFEAFRNISDAKQNEFEAYRKKSDAKLQKVEEKFKEEKAKRDQEFQDLNVFKTRLSLKHRKQKTKIKALKEEIKTLKERIVFVERTATIERTNSDRHEQYYLKSVQKGKQLE